MVCFKSGNKGVLDHSVVEQVVLQNQKRGRVASVWYLDSEIDRVVSCLQQSTLVDSGLRVDKLNVSVVNKAALSSSLAPHAFLTPSEMNLYLGSGDILIQVEKHDASDRLIWELKAKEVRRSWIEPSLEEEGKGGLKPRRE